MSFTNCIIVSTSHHEWFVVLVHCIDIKILQKQPSEVFLRKVALKICSKFTGEHPYLRNFIEITLRHGCSLVNLLYIFRTPFLKSTSGRLLLILVITTACCINQKGMNQNTWYESYHHNLVGASYPCTSCRTTWPVTCKNFISTFLFNHFVSRHSCNEQQVHIHQVLEYIWNNGASYRNTVFLFL